MEAPEALQDLEAGVSIAGSYAVRSKGVIRKGAVKQSNVKEIEARTRSQCALYLPRP